MLEATLTEGTKFTWKKPNDGCGPKNKDLIPSKSVASSLMIGAHGVSYDWLDYSPGDIAWKRMGALDILTGWMSGCYLVTWNDAGATFAGHIGTETGQAATNTTLKVNFGEAMKIDGQLVDVTGYNPSDAWSDDQIKTIFAKYKIPLGSVDFKIVGLITGTRRYYSLFLLAQSGINNGWMVGGIEEVTPISGQILLDRMKTT